MYTSLIHLLNKTHKHQYKHLFEKFIKTNDKFKYLNLNCIDENFFTIYNN